MSESARPGRDSRVRDYGSRKIVQTSGNGSRGVNLPKQLEETGFPTDLGDEVRIVLEDENRVVLEAPEA